MLPLLVYRVKRIVAEDSSDLFLTVSEVGPFILYSMLLVGVC